MRSLQVGDVYKAIHGNTFEIISFKPFTYHWANGGGEGTMGLAMIQEWVKEGSIVFVKNVSKFKSFNSLYEKLSKGN